MTSRSASFGTRLFLSSAGTLGAPDGLHAPRLRSASAGRAATAPGRPFAPPLLSVAEALVELRAGRVVGLRHSGGYSLVAPAVLASAPLIEAIERAARSPVSLVLSAADAPARRAKAVSETRPIGTHAARAAAIHRVLRGGEAGASTTALVVEVAHPGGVLAAPAGAAEGARDLVRAADFEGGAMVAALRTTGDVESSLTALDVAFVCVSDLAAHVAATRAPVGRVVTAHLPTKHGDFESIGYHAAFQDMEFLAAVRGDCAGAEMVPLSVHEGCVLGEALRSSRCRCGPRFEAALRAVGRLSCGIVIRLEPDRTTPFGAHAPPDPCRMSLVTQVVQDLGPRSVVLVETDPAVAEALAAAGCPVAR